MSDRILGICALLFALGFVFEARRISAPFLVDPLGPQTFPMLVGGLIGAAALWPLVRPDPAPAWPAPGRIGELVAAFAAMVLYALALRPLGFLLATVPFAAFLAWRLGGGPGASLLFGLLVALLLRFVFASLLGLSLPSGPLGF